MLSAKELLQQYDELNLNRFSYRQTLEHLQSSPYYVPERDDRQMISNLDGRWMWCNSSINESLCEIDFNQLAGFIDSLDLVDVSTLILGVDEIEWTGEKVEKGTYGFEKADCTYGLGKNYLSNSVIIGRAYQQKRYTAQISFEKRFEGNYSINKLVESIGRITKTTSYFAPENENERKEWESIAYSAGLKFNNAISKISMLDLESIENESPLCDSHAKINIGHYINKYLCNDGWHRRKHFPNECPIVITNTKNETSLSLSIISGHNGHHLQVLVYYRNPRFLYAANIQELSYGELAQANMDSYFSNVKKIRDYLFEVL